ncbi:DUF924 family protein [Pelomonas sp. V22]|uniref:DUF924 family protein n=1 Tax=Pelomonas sp. V22 TaxID=2822139 RepID=UPI0024A8A386|nr:DUF924 family protein [Pelomonas sp. V22]
MEPLDIVQRMGGFSAEVEGEALELDYMQSGGQIVFHHTFTADALRGRGLAGQMVEHGLRWAAEQERPVVAACSYVAAWLDRHPAWQRVTEPTPVQQVLNFWFGSLGSAEDDQLRGAWFRKSEVFDEEIRSRFGALLEQALAGGLKEWERSSHGSLARIVLLDQFTRNAFRNMPRAFAGDAEALRVSLALLESGKFKSLTTLQRWFALMPLEHAEDLAMQDRSVAAFEQLAAEDERMTGALDYAIKHREVVAQYGRFPHRNALLGRESTAAELAYLAQPGAGF